MSCISAYRVSLKDLPIDIIYYILVFCDRFTLSNYDKTCKKMRRILHSKSNSTSAFWRRKYVNDHLIIDETCHKPHSKLCSTFREYMRAAISNYKVVKMFRIMEQEFYEEMTTGEILTDELRRELYNTRNRNIRKNSKPVDFRLKPNDRRGGIYWGVQVHSRNDKFIKLENKLIEVIPSAVNYLRSDKLDVREMKKGMATVGNKYYFEVYINVHPTSFGVNITLVQNYNVDYGESGPPMRFLFRVKDISLDNVIAFSTMLTRNFPQVEWCGRYHGITAISFNEKKLRMNMDKVTYSNIAPFHKRLELLEKYG